LNARPLGKADLLHGLALRRQQAKPNTHPVYLDFIEYLRTAVPESRPSVVAVLTEWIEGRHSPEFFEALAIARALKLNELDVALAPRISKLGSAAIEYLRSYLWPNRPLSRGLASLPLEKGDIFTWLPAALDPDQVDLHEGALGLSAIDSHNLLTSFVSRYLQEHANGIAIFEDQVASAGDAWLASEPCPYVVHGTSLYFYRTSNDARTELVSKTIAKAVDWRSVGALISSDEDTSAFQQRQEVGGLLLERLGERAEHMFVGAYDGDGFLVWSRHSAAQP